MIKVEDINSWLELKNDNAVLLDVRTDMEWEEGRLAEATQINVQGPEFASRIAELDKDKEYYIYCRSGMRSAMAAGAMIRQGFASVTNLEGGILGWNGEVER